MVLALRRSKAFAKSDKGTVGAHHLCAEIAGHVPSIYSKPQTISSGPCFLNFVTEEEIAQRKNLILKVEKTYKKESCASLFGQNLWEIRKVL